jgi:hypothetical protein
MCYVLYATEDSELRSLRGISTVDGKKVVEECVLEVDLIGAT